MTELPDSVVLRHPEEPELAESLCVIDVTSDEDYMILELLSTKAHIANHPNIYTAKLKVTWSGPAEKFAEVKSRIAYGIKGNFAQIKQILKEFRQLFLQKNVTTARLLLENYLENGPLCLPAVQFLSQLCEKALGTFKIMLSMKSVYVDPDNRNTLSNVQALAGLEQQIATQLQELADLVHSCQLLMRKQYKAAKAQHMRKNIPRLEALEYKPRLEIKGPAPEIKS